MPKANNSYLKKEDHADIMQINFQLKLSQYTRRVLKDSTASVV